MGSYCQFQNYNQSIVIFLVSRNPIYDKAERQNPDFFYNFTFQKVVGPAS